MTLFVFWGFFFFTRIQVPSGFGFLFFHGMGTLKGKDGPAVSCCSFGVAAMTLQLPGQTGTGVGLQEKTWKWWVRSGSSCRAEEQKAEYVLEPAGSVLQSSAHSERSCSESQKCLRVPELVVAVPCSALGSPAGSSPGQRGTQEGHSSTAVISLLLLLLLLLSQTSLLPPRSGFPQQFQQEFLPWLWALSPASHPSRAL